MPFDFGLDESQRLLQESAAAAVRDLLPFTLARSSAEGRKDGTIEAWDRLCELGYANLAGSPATGGSGLRLTELMLVAVELGRRATPVPFVSHNVVLKHLSQTGYLAPIPTPAKNAMVGLAHFSTTGAWRSAEGATLEVSSGVMRLTGTRWFVPYGQCASAFLITAECEGGIATVLANSDEVICRPYNTTSNDHRAVLEFDVVLPTERIVAQGDREVVSQLATDFRLGTAAYLTGAATSAMTMGVEYSKNRVIFGRPLGTFQAAQHRMAECLYLTQAMYWLLVEAVWSVDQGTRDPSTVETACAYVSKAAQQVAAHVHQIHGAVGYTFEHDLSLLSTTIKGSFHDLGRYTDSLDAIASGMGVGVAGLDRRRSEEPARPGRGTTPGHAGRTDH